VLNGFLVVFAVLYLAEHVTGLWLTFLNLRHVQQHAGEVPSYFREKISLQEYQQSIRYTHDKAYLGIRGSLVGIPLFWGLLLTGFFGKADDGVRSLGFSSVLTGLLFLALMSGLFYLFALPFNLYLTFVIEKKYGFNRTTFKIWITDLLKGLVLLALVTGPLVAAILWLMEHFLKGFWWLYVWVLVALFQFFVVALFPVLILPIFNKLTPLPEGSLRHGIEELASKVSFKISGIFTMDGSKRSTHSNAFFAGIGKFRRIVLFDTLVSVLNKNEVLAVLAHEMGHNVKKHVRTGLIVSLGSSLLALAGLSQVVQSHWFYEAFGFGSLSSYAALFIAAKVSGTFTFFLLPLFSMLSRKYEYDADRFAAEAIGDAEPMIQSLVKLSKDNLSNLTPHPLYSFFYYSHPATLERIQALERR
jgi:STE24 endopeptidase